MPRGDWLALCALLAPWALLSLLLPLPHKVAALALLVALAALLHCAARWSELRANALGLDPDTWALAGILTLGYGQLLLLGPKGRSGFDRFCGGCGRMSDARAPFCHACGSFA